MNDAKVRARRALADTLAPLKDTGTSLYGNALRAVYSTIETRGVASAMEHAQAILERYEDVQLTRKMDNVA